MEYVGRTKLWSYLSPGEIEEADNGTIQSGDGCPVNSYLDLATKVAGLQFLNRDYVLLFRGQNADHKNTRGNTSLKPSLLRTDNPREAPDESELIERFEYLEKAERTLVSYYPTYSNPKFHDLDRLKKYRVLRWSILQHYKVCKTPLLDVTHSLRIAASFATLGAEAKAYVYVLGVPHIGGAVTASAESGLQIIRLASVCPPAAVRPHIQEGYLLGEYPEMGNFDQKINYKHYEIDFGRRLVAKFYFNPKEFWRSEAFPQISEQDLYPNTADPIFDLALKVQGSLSSP